MATRPIVENGILLCNKHHTLVENCKGTTKYEQIIGILIGLDVYLALKELAQSSLKTEDIEDNMVISSDVWLE
jgi:hypothetical protein